MSFDLYVYIDDSIDDNISHWQECLEKAGIVSTFPKGIKLSTFSHEEPIQCQLFPPLAEKGTYVDGCEFFIEVMPVDEETMAELIENSNDDVLTERLKNSKYWITINTFDEDDSVAAKIKNFVSATLANAYDGVLFDPQEFGGVYNAKVYEVARYYAEFHSNQNKVEKPASQKAASEKSKWQKSNQQKPKEESTVLVRAGFVILFIIVLFKFLKTL